MAAATGLSLSGRLFFGSLCAGTFGLGIWQTRRYYEKTELVAKREEELQQEPMDLDEFPTGYRLRSLKGVYIHKGELLVGPRGPPPGALASSGPSSGRSEGGMARSPVGYYVITPMLQKPENRLVFINRGWIPQSLATQSIPWDRPQGMVQVSGIPRKCETPKYMTPEHDFSKKPPRLYFFDRVAMQQSLGLEDDQSKFVLLAQARNEKRNNDREFPVQPPVDSIGEFTISPLTHLSYAFTWFSLSGAGVYMTRKLITRGRG